MFPQQLAASRIKTENPLSPADALLVEGVIWIRLAIAKHPVHQIDPTGGYSRPGIAHPHRRSPEIGQLSRQFFNDARLTPDTITLRAPPLRPVIGGEKPGPSQY